MFKAEVTTLMKTKRVMHKNILGSFPEWNSLGPALIPFRNNLMAKF